MLHKTSLAAVVGSGLLLATLSAHAQQYTVTDLGALGGTTVGWGINASGQVTGQADFSGNAGYHAFLYSNGSMQDLGTLGGTDSIGYGLNSSGQVTGSSGTSGDAATHAFLYSNGSMVDLNSEIGSYAALYTLEYGEAINNAGQIVANGIVKGTGQDVAFLLTPTASAPEIDPSAATSALTLLVGGILVLARPFYCTHLERFSVTF